MQATTAVTRAAQPSTDTRPRSLAVFAGGADAIDAALTDAVRPALERVGVERWSFLRWTGKDGPCVRLELETGDDDARELARLVEGRLEPGATASIPEPLLPRPVSWLAPGGAVSVRWRSADEELLGPLHRLSSEVALRALPEFRDGGARCALGLALMATTARAALGPGAAAELWHDAARGLTGDDDRGERLRAGLARRSQELEGQLTRAALGARREGASAVLLERWGDGCCELVGSADVHRHAHLGCNRLGVTPLEEALLALVLAGGAPRTTHRGASSRPPGRAVLNLDGVSKPGVLEGVSLAVHEGEVVVLVGPDGAGKSTLLGIAAGLRLASAGSALVVDRDPRDSRRAGAPGAELAMPDAELADEATVRDSVELHLKASEAETAGIVDAVLAETGLHEDAATPIAELGPGARRRVAIACALVQEPAVLLLDDPTAGLSAIERDEVWHVIGRRREEGGATVIASGSIQEALCVSDRAGLILGGRLEALGAAADIAGEFFPERVLRFHVEEKPDRDLLRDLPDVDGVEIDERVDHCAVQIATRQPRELLALLEDDPDFPEIFNVDDELLEGPFAARQS